jgi:hypothetical protein
MDLTLTVQPVAASSMGSYARFSSKVALDGLYSLLSRLVDIRELQLKVSIACLCPLCDRAARRADCQARLQRDIRHQQAGTQPADMVVLTTQVVTC